MRVFRSSGAQLIHGYLLPRRIVLFLWVWNTFLLGFTALGQAYNTAEAGISIREIQIPMPDGERLAADLYLPENSTDSDRFTIILEYLPYRKDEGRTHRFPFYSYFVRQGYMIARVDIRGTGRSTGKLVDGEYSDQELADGETVIEWLSQQPFSSGSIAMIGISWGGFNALQLAMRRPPALKTIISLMSTDDIYQDDVHFMDGILHIDAYEIGQDLANALPGAPDFTIDEAYFKNRFDTEPWLLKYKRQQTDGPFWDRASLNTDYRKIDIPVFIVGGWYDGYRDFIARMLENADVPLKALLGPWNHTWPNTAYPEPAIEWRDTAVRWLDYWMKGIENGISQEPALTYYQRGYHRPGTELDSIPGSWRTSAAWPVIDTRIFYLQANNDLLVEPDTFEHTLHYSPSAGVEAGGSVMWWGDWAPDQAKADRTALVYETEKLEDSIQIMGFPTVNLNVSATAPAANWVVRLSDVAPDGAVTLITGAGLNGTHRRSSEHPEPLQPDSIYPINIEMHTTSWTFRKGHRIRLAVINAQWPMFWPSPYPMKTQLHSSNSNPAFLSLPVILPESSQPLSLRFARPAADPTLPDYKSLDTETGSGFAEVSGITRDTVLNSISVTASNSGKDRYPWGEMQYTEWIKHTTHEDRPAQTRVESRYVTTVILPGRVLAWTGELDFSSDLKNYYYRYTRRLEENGKTIREKHWDEIIKRE